MASVAIAPTGAYPFGVTAGTREEYVRRNRRRIGSTNMVRGSLLRMAKRFRLSQQLGHLHAGGSMTSLGARTQPRCSYYVELLSRPVICLFCYIAFIPLRNYRFRWMHSDLTTNDLFNEYVRLLKQHFAKPLCHVRPALYRSRLVEPRSIASPERRHSRAIAPDAWRRRALS